MKAIVYESYGPPDILQFREVAKPSPKEDELLIRVRAASINSRDGRMLRANPFFIRLMVGGLLKPKHPILGADFSGQVEAVGGSGGAGQPYQPGDAVFGCLSGFERGTFAEYVCVKADELALKPTNCTFEQAAAVPMAAITALQGLRDKGNIQPGQKVLIQGASGGVGTFAVQLAKAFGAEVTGVCSTRNLEMVRSLGADHVIDYKKEDFTRSGQRYDLIFAANGYHPISHYLRALSPAGTYVVAGGAMLQLLQAALQGRRNGKPGAKKAFLVSMVHNPQDLQLMKELLETGKLKPLIDHCYPLEKTVEAFRYFEQVHPQGKIVITMA